MDEYGNNGFSNEPDNNYNTFDNIQNDSYNNFENIPDNYDNNFNMASNGNFDDSLNMNNDAYTGAEIDTPILNIPTSNSQPVNVDQNFAESTESTLNALGVEPTAAELEDMKREQAAKRRKRMLREKRRKERMRQAIIRCSILAIAAILVIVIIVKIFAGIGSLIKNAKDNKEKATEQITTEATTTEEPVAQIDEAIVAKDIPKTREEALTILNEQAETNSDIKNIVENAAVYPDIVLQHLAANSELIDFTLFYPAQISIPFDGDFTIENFDTNSVPLFLQYDKQWAYADYGKTVLGLNGAAPACLSMAYVYLTGDGSKNPIIIGDFSMDNGYLNEDGYTDYKLMTEGAEELGLESAELDMNKDNIIAALEEGNAIICAVLSGDFTKDKSYIVIKEYRNGLFYINDPSSSARSEVGWDYKRLSSQISTMWSLKKGTAALSNDSTDSESSTDSDASTDGTSNDNSSTDGSDAGTDSQTDGGADTDNATE